MKTINNKIIWRLWQKTSKHFAFVSKNFLKISKEMTTVIIVWQIVVLHEIYREKSQGANSYVHLSNYYACTLNFKTRLLYIFMHVLSLFVRNTLEYKKSTTKILLLISYLPIWQNLNGKYIHLYSLRSLCFRYKDSTNKFLQFL